MRRGFNKRKEGKREGRREGEGGREDGDGVNAKTRGEGMVGG